MHAGGQEEKAVQNILLQYASNLIGYSLRHRLFVGLWLELPLQGRSRSCSCLLHSTVLSAYSQQSSLLSGRFCMLYGLLVVS